MEIKAKLKNLRISPRKIRLVVDVIRGMEVSVALSQLKFINKKAVKPLEKLIKSGVANAEHNYELDKDNLYIKEIRVDEGATLHRWMPRAYGRATPIRKRASHILLTLAEIKDSGKKESKKQKVAAPIKLDGGAKKSDKTTKKALEDKKTASQKEAEPEKAVDSKSVSKTGQASIEKSSQKGFVKKFFRRKSG